jgi:hypothetical protein
MMPAEELRSLARRIREDRTHPIDDALIDRMAADVEGYRKVLADAQSQVPPEQLADRLRAMGWLIYEASLRPLWTIPPDAVLWTDATHDVIGRIYRLVDLTRGLPWPEFAPRALGSLRVAALLESKRDTEAGYDAAWSLHEEARMRYEQYRETLQTSAAAEHFVRDLDEVLLQLALAETGTACRAAERVIGLWAEGVADGTWTEHDSGHWTQRMFRELMQGAEVGEQALRIAADIDRTYGFTAVVNEHRLAQPTSYRNPAVMTCRALLLLYSMSREMADIGRAPKAATWDDYRAQLLDRFFAAFSDLRRDVFNAADEKIPLEPDHLRSMVQLCLLLALLTPGKSLDKDLEIDGTLTIRRLDDAAVEALCHWLDAPKVASKPDGARRGDGSTVGSASKPSFIAAVEASRRDGGTAAGYRAWRRRWPQLDRYRDRDGRQQRLGKIFDAIPDDEPLPTA